jgi:hypothetical protein
MRLLARSRHNTVLRDLLPADADRMEVDVLPLL